MTAAAVTRDQASSLERLSLYQQRIHSAFQKHNADLKKLQAERKAKREAELNEARELSQLSKLRHLPYDPQHNGFDFSNDEIERAIERYHRLNLAQGENFTYCRNMSGHYRIHNQPEPTPTQPEITPQLPLAA